VRVCSGCVTRSLLWLTAGRVAVQDTAGSERFEAMSRIYYRDAKAAVICFGGSRGRCRRGRHRG
jgi:hypothetical protein